MSEKISPARSLHGSWMMVSCMRTCGLWKYVVHYWPGEVTWEFHRGFGDNLTWEGESLHAKFLDDDRVYLYNNALALRIELKKD